MSFPQATVNKVLTYSLVDGPGNRLVVFLQGCNFACPTCHNPYTIGMCDHCGDCVPACHSAALTMENDSVVFDPTLCDGCDECLRICPISASPMVQRMGVEDILNIARRNRAFLSGITVSGGEATLQLKFVVALFEAVKADPDLRDLTCFVDTNGHLGPRGWEKLLPVTDGVMLDVKAFGVDLHEGLTGQGNAKVLKSAQILFDAGRLHELRYLVIPGKTDTPSEIASLIEFLHSFGPQIRLRLNAFQHHGVRGAALEWPTAEKAGIENIRVALEEAGYSKIVTPAVYL